MCSALLLCPQVPSWLIWRMFYFSSSCISFFPPLNALQVRTHPSFPCSQTLSLHPLVHTSVSAFCVAGQAGWVATFSQSSLAHHWPLLAVTSKHRQIKRDRIVSKEGHVSGPMLPRHKPRAVWAAGVRLAQGVLCLGFNQLVSWFSWKSR